MPAITLTPTVDMNGQPLSTAFQAALLEIRVEREFQVPGRVTLRFTDPGYVLVADSTIALGTSVTVADPSDSSVNLITAEITSVAVEDRVHDQPELVVVAHDKSHRLGRATLVTSYLNMAYSDIVSQLASSAGLTPAVDSTTTQLDYTLQVDSDLGLITEMARRVGYDWWVDGTSLNFKKPASTGSVSLTLGDDLLSFSARASGHHPDAVVVDGWDRDQQTLVTATASTPTSAVQASSDLASLALQTSSAFGSATITSTALASQSQAESTALSQAILDRGAASAVWAQGLAEGNGGITLGKSVEVSGTGVLSGTYPVTKVEHTYRPRGYMTKFTAGDRRPTSLVDSLAGRGGSPSPGYVHPGVTVGQVTNINDPNNAGRVKVRYPGLSSSDESNWARIVGVGGGTSRGNVFIPEVDDEVLVAFEGGDPRQPVVIGGLFGSKSTIPSTTISDGQVQARGMTSRLGHVIQLQDGTDPSKQSIDMALAGNEFAIHLGKDKLTIQVPSGTAVEISAGSTSVKFGTDGSMALAGPTISIQATSDLKLSGATVSISADTQLSLEGQATAALKGAEVQVSGDAMTSIKGGMVMIN